MSELLVITQLFLFLRPRVSVKASSTCSLLDIAESSNRRVLPIMSYETVDRGSVSLLGLFVQPPLFVCTSTQLYPGSMVNKLCVKSHAAYNMSQQHIMPDAPPEIRGAWLKIWLDVP